ncbi:GIY-YIG nuclease family protein [Vibrio sp. CK2-1]|uniref:GIY-YIG nuclease family protein n=1 Tax=Vibrio sp. CK2-1 TaxID=2912249 RepID=UPI001F2916C4|nr:GIY-YIG nuclease family protein [Vibrio sp. CK2-1]MCF7352776.1 GIY-YIG nuclease family protein [Vibrio sp. CK2-1]
MPTTTSQPTEKSWFVYLIRTRTKTLYCGITNDLERRFEQHQTGKGAKYLRGKGPLSLVWSQQVADKSAALKEEIRIKKLSKATKEKLIAQ